MVDTAGNASSTSLTTSGNINVGGNLTVSGTANISGISFTSANASTTYLTVGNTAWINNLVATNGTITNASTTYATLPTFWSTNGTITNASSTYLSLSNGFWQTSFPTCSASQKVLYDATTGIFSCGDDATGVAGGGIVIVQEGGVSATTTADTLNFTAADFVVATSSQNTAVISIDYTNSYLTRKNQNETITGIWTIPEFNFTNATGTRASITNGTITNASTTYLTVGTTLFGGNCLIRQCHHHRSHSFRRLIFHQRNQYRWRRSGCCRRHLAAKCHCHQWLCCFRFLIQC